LIEQLATVAFSHGPFVLLAVAAAATLWICHAQRVERAGWLWLVCTWALPQYLFWCFIRGNNMRHLLLAPVPLFWLAGLYLQQRGKEAMVEACIAVLAFDLVIPPNSNMSIYPSPNVPASTRLVRLKEQRLRAAAERLLTVGQGDRACYFGLSTVDHVSAFLLDELERAGMQEQLLSGPDFRIVVRQHGARTRQVDVIPGPPPGSRYDDEPCSITESLEYDGRDRTAYFGDEWDRFSAVVSLRNFDEAAGRARVDAPPEETIAPISILLKPPTPPR
jgi:hypothetical protein